MLSYNNACITEADPMSEETLFRYNPWWEESGAFPAVVERPEAMAPISASLGNDRVCLLTGLRRTGKTTLMKMLIRDLIGPGGTDPRHICYVSLDDYTLSGESILQVVERYRRIHRLESSRKVYLFLDEVASHGSFEQQLKNLHDSQQVKVYASSSSASLLQDRKAFLTGRSEVVEVMPLDFAEYLRFKGLSVKKRDEHLLDAYFEDFLKTGGLPEYVLHGNDEHLRDLVDDIIMKDIAARYGVRNTGALKDLFLLLMERAGKVASINKLANIQKVSVDTVRRYADWFARTYLVHLVPRHGTTNERLLSAKKVYAADTGIRSLFTGFRDKGSLFENYVYLKLRARKPQYVFQNGSEIDFLTTDSALVEVKYQGEMSAKQAQLFKDLGARRKALIRGRADLEEFLRAPHA